MRLEVTPGGGRIGCGEFRIVAAGFEPTCVDAISHFLPGFRLRKRLTTRLLTAEELPELAQALIKHGNKMNHSISIRVAARA